MTINLRIGGYQGPNSVHSRAMNDLIAHLHGREQAGQIDFRMNVTEDGQAAADLPRMVGAGDLDLCYFSSSYLTSQIPAMNSFEMPFGSGDRDQFYALLDGSAGQHARDEAAALSPYVVLGLWDNGVRHISNRGAAIRSPSDCEGLRIRTLDNAFHQSVFRALGFTPQTIDVRDLANAVATGEVDAQENPLTNIVNFDLHKYHRYVTLTAHFFGVALLLCNRTTYANWSGEQKRVMEDAASHATSCQRRHATEEDDRCLEVLKDDGVQITELTLKERTAFVAAVSHLSPE